MGPAGKQLRPSSLSFGQTTSTVIHVYTPVDVAMMNDALEGGPHQDRQAKRGQFRRRLGYLACAGEIACAKDGRADRGGGEMKPKYFSSTPMVQAFLDGAKNHTRRVIKPDVVNCFRCLPVDGPNSIHRPRKTGDAYPPAAAAIISPEISFGCGKRGRRRAVGYTSTVRTWKSVFSGPIITSTPSLTWFGGLPSSCHAMPPASSFV